MMLAAPEFIEAERVDLLDEIKVAAKLQHRMLADGVMRGEEGSEFEACHGFLSGRLLLLIGLFSQATCWKAPRQSRKAASEARLSCRLGWHTVARIFPASLPPTNGQP